AAVVSLQHTDMVDSFPVAIMHPERLPLTWQARREMQLVCFKPQTEKRFQDKPVHPSSRSRVPRPSSAANMWRDRIYVCRDNIWFYFVGFDLPRRFRMVYRVDQRKQLPRAPAVAQLSEGHRAPDSRM